MSLNPEIAAFLDLVDASQDDASTAFHHQTPEQARQAFEQSSIQMRWDVAPVQSQDLAFTARDGANLALRVYRPLNHGGEPLPVLLYLHGGGFVVGSLDSHDGVCRELCARTPCAVLAVEYRRAPEHKFPTALEDCADGLAWLADNAQTHGLDTSRLVYGGDSVGATLATVLAIDAVRHQRALKPCLQLLCYPVADASQRSESMDFLGEGYLLESDTLEWFYDHYARTPADRLDWRFSPLLAPDLSDVAPAFIALAGFDPLLDEGRAYARRLAEQGVQVECREFEGLVHDFLRMRMVTEEIESVYGRLAQVLRRKLY
ncbi:alpha/beta hydrolase [Pseudomonas yamanorum]|uniref:alpha/beta hydrolase n=1 Tax=Pseudomonas yamanorum TaxID=515393 RepID=UPI0015A383FA|nr:alpha/beta hydrolase [Pseudomonas yamanorum]NWD27655.1 alpha/beta hydrolase [Pseudomonas yamanorum]